MKLRLCQWNIENLYAFMDYYKGEDLKTISNQDWQALSASTTPNKHIGKIEECAKVISEINPDILMINEIGGVDSAKNFNKYFLNDQFQVFMNNDNTRIQSAFFVKKHLTVQFKFISTASVSRGISQLSLNNLKIWLVHLKSKVSVENDFQGLDSRKKSVTKFLKTYQENTIIAGDLNATIRHEEEFKELFQLPIKSFHDDLNTSFKDRVTHVGFYPKQTLNELDYILLPKNMKVLGGERFMFKNGYDDKLGLPESMSEKLMQPSDHFPIFCDIEI